MTKSPKGEHWRLEPESGVEIVDGRMQATSRPVWLRVEPVEAISSHRWIRLRYSSGFFDEPVRPLIRFVTASGQKFVQPMNGAILGSAEWIGRVPDRTVSVSISPVDRPGPFSFRIERLVGLWRSELLRRGWFKDPAWAFWATRSWLTGSREEAWQALSYALGGTPFKHYSEWHARFSRALEIDGIDRPRLDWNSMPTIHLLMQLYDCDVESMLASLQSLEAQVYRHWKLHAAVGDRTPAAVLAALRAKAAQDQRFAEFRCADASADLDIADDDRVALIEPGDTLPEYGLAVVAERLAEQPELAVLYSDEDAIGASGRRHSPVLKPDWSPRFYKHVSYVGRLTCIRWADLSSSGAGAADLLAHEHSVLAAVLARAGRNSVGHIRRLLYSRKGEGALTCHRSMPNAPTDLDPTWPEVCIVIPTRDRADLLKDCIRRLKDTTDYPSYHVVIVDNGSTQPEALALLESFRNDGRFKVLKRPGPFNFSKLSNDGARSSKAAMLVFLNNDIQLIDAGWLKAMVRWAVQTDVGVVGTKLLFPNGTIQHAGVVLGMGGIAGHVYRRCSASEPGYLHQVTAVREATAVTAACICIAREKFDRVSGFDADNLPIDLNDIDLCLRVNEAGWINILTPQTVMIHLQSASRGIDRDPFEQYRQERTYFTERWLEAIRDDRYFHPGLTLRSQTPELS